MKKFALMLGVAAVALTMSAPSFARDGHVPPPPPADGVPPPPPVDGMAPPPPHKGPRPLPPGPHHEAARHNMPGKPVREVKHVVGYVETTQTLNDRDAEFHRIDTSGDGAINFAEFQKAAMLQNEFEMFDMNDTNNDNLLTIDEYRNFSKMGPARTSEGPSMVNYNFNKKPSTK